MMQHKKILAKEEKFRSSLSRVFISRINNFQQQDRLAYFLKYDEAFYEIENPENLSYDYKHSLALFLTLNQNGEKFTSKEYSRHLSYLINDGTFGIGDLIYKPKTLKLNDFEFSHLYKPETKEVTADSIVWSVDVLDSNRNVFTLPIGESSARCLQIDDCILEEEMLYDPSSWNIDCNEYSYWANIHMLNNMVYFKGDKRAEEILINIL